MPFGQKRPCKKLYTNACDKKKNRPQMPVAKKDQTTNASGKRKMAALIRQANRWHQIKERPNHKSWCQTKKGCPNQASKQLTPNERNKTSETTSKTQIAAYLHTQGGKNTTKSWKSNRLLSATNEWTTTVKATRAQSKNNCANRWKAKLTITNINLN